MALPTDYIRGLLLTEKFLGINQEMLNLHLDPEDPEVVVQYCEIAITAGNQTAMLLLELILETGSMPNWKSDDPDFAKAVRQATKLEQYDRLPRLRKALWKSSNFRVKYHVVMMSMWIPISGISMLESLIEKDRGLFISLAIEDKELTDEGRLRLLCSAGLTNADIELINNKQELAALKITLQGFQQRIQSIVEQAPLKVRGLDDIDEIGAELRYIRGLDGQFMALAMHCADLILEQVPEANLDADYVGSIRHQTILLSTGISDIEEGLNATQRHIAITTLFKTLDVLKGDVEAMRQSIIHSYAEVHGIEFSLAQSFTPEQLSSRLKPEQAYILSCLMPIQLKIEQQRQNISETAPHLPENFAEQIRGDLKELETLRNSSKETTASDIQKQCVELITELNLLQEKFTQFKRDEVLPPEETGSSYVTRCDELLLRVMKAQAAYAIACDSKQEGSFFQKLLAPTKPKEKIEKEARGDFENTLKKVSEGIKALKDDYRLAGVRKAEGSVEDACNTLEQRQNALDLRAQQVPGKMRCVYRKEATGEFSLHYLQYIAKQDNDCEFFGSKIFYMSLWKKYIPWGETPAQDFFDRAIGFIINEWKQALDGLEQKIDAHEQTLKQEQAIAIENALQELKSQFASMQASLRASYSKLASISYSGLDEYKVAPTQEENEISKMFQAFINEPPQNKRQALDALIRKIKSFDSFEVKKAEFLSEPLSLRYLAFSDELSRKIALLSKASGNESKLRLLQGVEEKLDAAWGYYFRKLAYFPEQHILEIAVNGGSLVSEFEKELNKAEKEVAKICGEKGTSVLFKDPEETFRNRHQKQEADFEELGGDFMFSYGVKRNPDSERALPKDLPLPDLSTRMRERLRELESAASAPPVEKSFWERFKP